MAYAVSEIEQQIDRSRVRLASNLDELGRKVESLTSWREHVRARPFWMLGLAAAGGAVIAAVTAPPRHGVMTAPGGERRGGTQARELIGHLQDALFGVAAVRLSDYLETLLPGFEEQFQRAKSRSESFR